MKHDYRQQQVQGDTPSTSGTGRPEKSSNALHIVLLISGATSRTSN
ncbi:MAG: hypothetical protein WC489_06275 [Patescibacteria group bacterium]